MRKTKIILLVSLIVALISVFCSCRCYPNMFEWNISSVKTSVNLSNGNTIRLSIPRMYSELNPLVVHQGMTHIEIKWNNKVIFKPYGSNEELKGTYKVDHHGEYRTSFTITFENGEKTENGKVATHALNVVGGNPFGAYMEFEFRGMHYSFCAGYEDDSRTEKESQEELEEFILNLRSGNYTSLQEGNIVKTSSGTRIYADFLYCEREYDDLYRDDLIVFAVKITADNQLIILDDIEPGECMFVHYVYWDNEYSSEKIREAYVIYYIEPLS